MDQIDLERYVISSIISFDKLVDLRDKGISPNSFQELLPVYEFVEEFSRNYEGKVPSIQVLEKKFDSFKSDTVIEDELEWHISELIKAQTSRSMQSVLERGIELLMEEEKPLDSLEYLISNLSELRPDADYGRSYTDRDAIERIDRLIEKVEAIKHGEPIGIPTGLEILDELGVSWLPGNLVGVIGSTKRGKCLCKGSKVWTKRGYINIEDVVLGDVVQSIDENNYKFSWCKVIDVIDNGKKEIYEVSFDSGLSIKLTKNHPVFTLRGWIKVEDLEEGESIIRPSCLLESETSCFLSNEELEILGYMISDGCCLLPSFTAYDLEINRRFRSLINFLYPKAWFSSIKQEGRSFEIRGGGERHNGLRELLEKVGLWGHKSIDKTLENFVYELDTNQIAILLGAMWCGDGEVKTYIAYDSCSEKLLSQVSFMLHRLGIPSKIYPNKHTIRVKLNDPTIIEKFRNTVGRHLIGDKLAQFEEFYSSYCGRRRRDSTFPMEIRKIIRDERPDYFWKASRIPRKDVYKQDGKRACPRKTLSSFAKKYDSTVLQNLSTSELWFDKVSTIRKNCNYDNTYDLEIEGNHNFIANGLVVHNSWLALYLSCIAYSLGKRVLFFSPELSIVELEARWDTIMGKITGYEFSNMGLVRGTLSNPTEYKDWLEQISDRSDWMSVVGDAYKKALTLGSIEDITAKFQPDIVVVDGIYLIKDSKKNINTWEKVMNVTYGLKSLATSRNIVVLASNQLGRGSTEKETPSIDEVGYSFAFAQAVDQCLIISKTENATIEEKRRLIRLTGVRTGVELPATEVEWDVDKGILGRTLVD